MIKYVDYYVPQARVTLETVFDNISGTGKLPAAFETQEDGIHFFRNVTGIQEVAHAAEITEAEQLHILLSRFFDSNITTPFETELFILIGDDRNKGDRMANLGHYLQHTFKMENADVLVLQGNHCSNVEYAVSYAENILASGNVSNIIIAAANKLLRHEDRIIGSYAIQGDGAGLVHLNADKEDGVLVHGKHSLTKGMLYQANVNEDNSLLLCKNYMLCIAGLMKKYKLKPAFISNVIIQNANHLLVTQCLTSLGFTREQVFTDNLTAYGHLDAIDFLVNLRSLMEKSPAKNTKMISFGTGWAGSNISLYLEQV